MAQQVDLCAKTDAVLPRESPQAGRLAPAPRPAPMAFPATSLVAEYCHTDR